MSGWGELRTAAPFRHLETSGRYSFISPCERCGGTDRVMTRLCFLYDADLCISCTRAFYVVCNAWSEQKELLKLRELSMAIRQALTHAFRDASGAIPRLSSELALNMDRLIDIEGACFLKAKVWVEEYQPSVQPSIHEFRNATLKVKAQIAFETLLSASDEQKADLLKLFERSLWRKPPGEKGDDAVTGG